jgi:lambda family phage portal protein
MGVRSWFAQQVLNTRHGRQQGKRLYEAARRNRLLQDFRAPTSSADAELRTSLRVLRDRACQLCRDNPYARQAKRTTQINVVGPRGIQMQGQIMKAGGTEKDTRRNRMLEEAWRRWCRADTCDVAGRLSFHGFEMMIAGSLPESGECLIRIVRQAMGQGRVPIALEIIEAHQLDEDKSGASDRAGHEWRLGVELNKWGRPTRYAILKRHPGDAELGLNKRETQKHEILSANDVIHIFMPERIGQNRGVPWLTSVITTVHNLAEYEGAHWVKKRVQAASLGWIRSPEGELIGDAVENGQRLINTEPGSWNFLEPGQEPVPPDFGPDDGQYDNVVRNLTRRFAAGFGCSYETLSRDFSQTNYSSSRLSILEDRDHWRVVQSVIIQHLHQRVFEEWLRAAVLVGELPSPAFDDYWTRPERYNAPRWQARSWSWVDPQKEMKAMELARQLLLQTHGEQIAEYTGEQFELVMAQIAKENELKEELGLVEILEESQDEGVEPEPDADEGAESQPQRSVA